MPRKLRVLSDLLGTDNRIYKVGYLTMPDAMPVRLVWIGGVEFIKN